VMKLDAMILVFWMLCFSQFFFTLLFYPSLSVIRVVSSAYMRLLILQAILIPACESSSPASDCVQFHWYNMEAPLWQEWDAIPSTQEGRYSQ
jgi:hypothetical protein